MIDDLSAELRDELAANSRPPAIDPKSVPVRFSWMKGFASSAAHAHHAVQNADRYSSTLATRIGSGAHAMTFGQPVYKFTPRRAGKAWEEFRADKGNAPILSAKEWDQSEAIAAALKNHEKAAQLLLADNVIVEQRLEWEIDGRKCAGTPDARSVYTLTDLKTAKTSQPDRFIRDATWRGYHAQIAWYRAGLEAAGVGRIHDCYIVAIESKAPHCVTVLKLTERALEQGQRLWRTWWEQLRVAEDSGVWPGYCEAVAEFDAFDDDLELTFGSDDEDEGETP